MVVPYKCVQCDAAFDIEESTATRGGEVSVRCPDCGSRIVEEIKKVCSWFGGFTMAGTSMEGVGGAG